VQGWVHWATLGPALGEVLGALGRAEPTSDSGLLLEPLRLTGRHWERHSAKSWSELLGPEHRKRSGEVLGLELGQHSERTCELGPTLGPSLGQHSDPAWSIHWVSTGISTGSNTWSSTGSSTWAALGQH
jgi:hypothetical protein